MREAHLTIRIDPSALRDVRGFVEDFVVQHAVARDEQHRLMIVLEELITNLAKYGYRDRPAGSAEVRLQLDESRLILEVVDDGDPFDPLKAPPPDFDAPLEDRAIGGLGVHIMRALADEISYRRAGERNVLQMMRRVALTRV
ncbi:MAG TPA: ATP-binding protein [Candidatus Binataceae bacterium]|jgi:anti-sigma regulatory factor (Ser/Thr protein kinase)|nr:ATP-binding protein [Candidatus Binataceae bacterium]